MRYDTIISKTIRKLRESLNKSVKEMANELNIRPFELNDIELGNSLPSLELAAFIKEKYNIDTDPWLEYINNEKRDVENTNVRKTTICYTRDIKSRRK